MARHVHEKMQVHPTALMVGADFGMTTTEMREVISMVSEANPALLIGGYNVDATIIGIVAVMRLEDHFQKPATVPIEWADTDRDEIFNRTNECLQVLYTGAF